VRLMGPKLGRGGSGRKRPYRQLSDGHGDGCCMARALVHESRGCCGCFDEPTMASDIQAASSCWYDPGAAWPSRHQPLLLVTTNFDQIHPLEISRCVAFCAARGRCRRMAPVSELCCRTAPSAPWFATPLQVLHSGGYSPGASRAGEGSLEIYSVK